MACKTCSRLVISDSVTFSGGNLLVDIPEGTYQRGKRYCILINQTIPEAATIYAPVYVTIGGVTTTLYPMMDMCCRQVTACALRTRACYAARVETDAAGGSFRLLDRLPCTPSGAPEYLPVAVSGGEGG